MPELPEVQTVVDTLRPQILGRRVAEVTLRRKDIVAPGGIDLAALLRGRRIQDIHRRAKRIVFTLDDGNCFYIHLGMSGRLVLAQADAPLARHTHLVILLDMDSVALGTVREKRAGLRQEQPRHGTQAGSLCYGRGDGTQAGSLCYEEAAAAVEMRFCDPRRFGGVWWLGNEGKTDEGLGPEPLNMGARQLGELLGGTRRAIKTALLDQRLIAGMGNIYADEALFAAGVHPLTPANELEAEQIRRLAGAIKHVLRQAIRYRGSTVRDYRDANGDAGSFQKLHGVYGRDGEACPRCQARIERIVLGGRSTHFCPGCQKNWRKVNGER